MTPANFIRMLVHKISSLGHWKQRSYNHTKPGEVIASLSSNERELLSNLSSEDLKEIEMHPDYWCDDYYNNKDQEIQYRNSKLEFDKKILNKC